MEMVGNSSSAWRMKTPQEYNLGDDTGETKNRLVAMMREK